MPIPRNTLLLAAGTVLLLSAGVLACTRANTTIGREASGHRPAGASSGTGFPCPRASVSG